MDDGFVEVALTCIKELEPMSDLRPLQTCLRSHGYDMNLDDTMSACKELRDLLYVDFRETAVAGPKKYRFTLPLALRVSGSLFLQGKR